MVVSRGSDTSLPRPVADRNRFESMLEAVMACYGFAGKFHLMLPLGSVAILARTLMQYWPARCYSADVQRYYSFGK